jgi:hypothetical protein
VRRRKKRGEKERQGGGDEVEKVSRVTDNRENLS